MAGLPQDVRDRVNSRLHREPPPYGEPPEPPATADDIEASEEYLGFPLPPAVRELYEIANGGGGFLGLVNGHVDDIEDNAVDKYESFLVPEDDPEVEVPWEWREGVLPIFDWGCNTYSCVDCTGDEPVMVGRDGFLWVPDGRPFVQWLGEWADGRVTQPAAR